MKKHFFYILSILQFCIVCTGYAQGLHFYGNEKRISERSSFCLFADDHIPDPTGRFRIAFEYATDNAESPGYILYLKNAAGEGAFNLTYVHEEGRRCFMFAQDGKQIYHTVRLDSRREAGKWMPVVLDMDLAHNRAEIQIGSQQKVLEEIGLKGGAFAPQPFFGMCNHILETASFSIRNLTVDNGEESWHFPLNENSGEEVHDSRGKVIGHITNPVWLINRSYHWKPLFQAYSSTPSGVAFEPQEQRFYLYNQDTLTTYSLASEATESLPYASGSDGRPIRLGMNLVDTARGTILAYELNQNETYIAEIDPAARTRRNLTTEATQLQLHHHCGQYDALRQRLLFFGGYGNRRYYNHLIAYDLAKNRWDTLTCTGDTIAPRFFAGMAVAPDGRYAYLYGGKGNEAGDQNVGIQYYYDLYRVDLERLHIEKLWQHEAPTADRVPARNMILSADGRYIYLLAYPEYKPETRLQMYRLSLSDGRCEALGDCLPLTSEEIATNANLHFNAEQDEFYCTIQEFEKHGQNRTRIYALANPPASLAAFEFYDKPAGLWPRVAGWLYPTGAVLGVTLVGVFALFVLWRKRRAGQGATSPAGAPQPAAAQEDPAPAPAAPAAVSAVAETPVDILLPGRPPRNNALLLFGTFCATDRNGRDITYMFSPKIRHLFLYLLVNSTIKDGVLSSDLNSLFWRDRPDDKIKNLKNVTINHLRKILQEMDGVELTHQQGYFRIHLSEECYCDYQRFFVLTGGMNRIPAEEGEMKELYGIFSQGRFLDAVESGLFDYAKQQVENFVIRLLSEQIRASYGSEKEQATLSLCKMLLYVDTLSDMAMTYTVCAYRRLNQSDRALQFYTAFCKEYRKVMGEEYPVTFEEVETERIRA